MQNSSEPQSQSFVHTSNLNKTAKVAAVNELIQTQTVNGTWFEEGDIRIDLLLDVKG